MFSTKLEGVCPVDNRPSTDKLHHFVPKNKCDMRHVTRDMWRVARDMWHLTSDTFEGGEHSLKKDESQN